MVIQYDNSHNRIVQLKDEYRRIGRQLALGDNTSIARGLVALPDVNEIIYQLIGKEIVSEITGLKLTPRY